MSADGLSTPYRVTLPEFEGPLDLLLHLCKTHELDILDIPIAFVTEKYIEYLDLMHAMSVDVAADYLVMAATLAYLKSRELVPNPEPLEAEEGEEGAEVQDPRQELIRRLLEYQKYKDAAEQLGGQPIEGRNVFGRGGEIEGGEGDAPLADHSVWKLIGALAKILEKAGPKVTHDVVVDRVSISARINQLVDLLEAGGGSFRFDACFDLAVPPAELRSQVVVTLLSILELARLKVVRLLQSEDGETLFVTQVTGASLDAARHVEITSAEGEPEAVAGADAAATSAVGGAVAAPAPSAESAAPAPSVGSAGPAPPAAEVARPIILPPPEHLPQAAADPAGGDASPPSEDPNGQT